MKEEPPPKREMDSSCHFRYRNGYLHQVEDPAGRVSEFRHDAAGNLVQLTYPDGSVLRYGYDGAHLLQERRDERGNRYR